MFLNQRLQNLNLKPNYRKWPSLQGNNPGWYCWATLNCPTLPTPQHRMPGPMQPMPHQKGTNRTTGHGVFRSLAEAGNQESKASPKVLPRLKTMKTQTLPERFSPDPESWTIPHEDGKYRAQTCAKPPKGISQLGLVIMFRKRVKACMFMVRGMSSSSVYVGIPHCLAYETTGPSGLQSQSRHHFVLNTGVRALDKFGYIWFDCDPDLWEPLLKTTSSFVIIIPNMIEQ